MSDYPDSAGSKGGGASAEIAEHITASGMKQRLEALVIGLYRRRPDWTPDEAAAALGEHPADIRPRFSELTVELRGRQPYLIKTDECRLSNRGNTQHVYVRVNPPMSTTTATKTEPFSWSYSALKNFESCPRRYYHYNVARDVKEEESEALRYGHSVHSAFEARVKTGVPLPMGMGMHERLLARLASAPGDIYAEQKLAMDASFEPVTWFGNGAWLRTVLDYTNVRPDGETATVLDYKTGKPSEDMTQMQLCAAMVFAHVPTVNRVKAGLVFIAYGQVERAEFVRDDLTEIWAEILPRVNRLAAAKAQGEYPPKPGGLCRRWCGVKSCAYNGK